MSDSEIVRDVSLAAKIAACEDNFAAFVLLWASLAHSSQDGALHDTPELAWGISGLPISLFNGIVRTRLAATSDADLHARIETALMPFKARQVPMVWWVTPSSHPADLSARLDGHGLTHAGADPAMAVDLAVLPELALPEGVEITAVTDLAGLRQVVDVVCAGYGAPAAFGEPFFALLAHQHLGGSPPYHTFLARRGTTPVATAHLLLAAGAAGIYCVATVPDARRQGIGAAVTLAPLLAARALGYRLGILTASAMGYGVYRRLGFEEVCQFNAYALLTEDGRDGRVDGQSGGQ